MTYPTLVELAERLAKDERVASVEITQSRTITAQAGHETSDESSVGVAMTRRGDPPDGAVTGGAATLRLAEDGRVIGATLAVSRPYWAVEAIRRALEIDP